ncbi:MAG: PAS domain S-box protein [Desulfobulbaceae bacterium]|nr:PAS domain S-box protein [Desulfobulbaceae bacterium]
MKSLRVRTLLIFFSTLVSLLLTVAIIAFYTNRFQTFSFGQIALHGKDLAKNIAFTVADDLITENYAALQELVQEYASRGEVIGIQISDPEGTILAASEVGLIGARLEGVPAGECDRNGQKVCVIIEDEQSRLIITTPIVVGSVELGKTRVVLSAHSVLLHLREIQRNGALIGLAFWLFFAGIGYWLAGFMTGPVQKFMMAAKRISQGDFHGEIPRGAWVYELEQFGRTLDTMATAIQVREQELQKSENKFRHLFERMIEGFFVVDAKGQIIDVNPAFVRILGGASRKIMLEQNLFANIFENEEAWSHFQQQIVEQGFVKDYELTLIKSDSSPVIVSLTCHMVRGKDGRILLYEGLIRDISAQKMAEREIVRMRNYLNNIIESMPSMLFTLDADANITQWNSAACRITGIAPDTAIGGKIYDIFPFFSKYSPQVEALNRQHIPLTLPRQRVMQDSDHFYNLILFPLVANGVNGVAVRFDDITELETMEQQLRQAQKMESIGILAGGLAHDFNNVLAAILGNLSLFQYKLRVSPDLALNEIHDFLAQMETAGQRAVDMVRQLLTLSRRSKGDLIPVDLNLSIKHIRKLGENTFDKSVQVLTFPAAHPAYVLADTTEVEQVLLNLCINGVHAMTIMRGEGSVWGGSLTIALDQVVVDPLFRKRYPDAINNTYWKLSVTDTGVGMDAKIMARVFDPFFTTKRQEEGTGLGLAMVYNIVRQQQGFMDVYSDPGLGATFNIYLPMLVREGEDVSSAEVPLVITRGEGLVLVVDDDAVVREMAENILKISGHTVITAENGMDGVAKYRQHHAEIKAVLLDMAMPVMSGREAFSEMKKIDPAIKVLLASGFRKDERVEEILGQGVKDFLQKPYTMAALTLAIKKVIDL